MNTTLSSYTGTTTSPFHLSVGAVILNQEGLVLCHHFDSIGLDGDTLTDLYLLVRETLEEDENLKQALLRGVMEETGATVKILDFLGSIISHFTRKGVVIEKTTVYFLCQLESLDESKRDLEDVEGRSKLMFLPFETLKQKMQDQLKRHNRLDSDERVVLDRAQEFLGRQA